MTDLIKMDGLDKALIGRSCIWDSSGRQEDRLVYSGEKIVAILIARDGMDADEAFEYIEFNIQGAYDGPQTPIIMWSEFVEELKEEYGMEQDD
jgi:hypothetical protein